jgi:hypothetical protein
MPQTIGAFMAILTVMTFTLNYQRSEMLTQQRLIGGELEVMANAVASETMNYVATKSFDAAVAADVVTRLDPNTSSLTPSSGFGGAIYADASDIDDFDGITDHDVFFEMEDGAGFNFVVKVAVNYVDDAGAHSMSPTLTKEVNVTVGGADGLFTPITITRQFSPQWY